MEENLTSCCSFQSEQEQMSRQSCRVPATCPPGFQGRYTVRPGDTMFFIAQRFGVSLQALINANPHIPNPAMIFPCDVLCVPGVPPPPPPVDCRVPVTCPPGFQGRYTVRPGDTMFFIAQRFGVSLQALINANPHIHNPNLIFPCDVLCVPGPPPPVDCRIPVTCPPGFQGRYTVQPGDTMFLIAQRFGVSLQALINANPHITNPNLIFPCDVLCVPGHHPPPPPPPPPPHKFKPPCCLLLTLVHPIPGSDAMGTALVQNLVTNQQAVTVLVSRVPLPSQVGPFNAHEVVIMVPSVGTFRFTLKQVQDNPTIFAGTINLDPGTLTAKTMIWVRPLNTKTCEFGDPLLSGLLRDCC